MFSKRFEQNVWSTFERGHIKYLVHLCNAPGRSFQVLRAGQRRQRLVLGFRGRGINFIDRVSVEHGAERFRLAINVYFPTGAKV